MLRRWTVGAIGAASLCLFMVASGLAATKAVHPKPGKYSGFTSEAGLNGFKPPVSFTVSKNRKELLGFKWAGSGCSGVGGPGDVWKLPGVNYGAGAIAVSSTGTFVKKNAKWVYRSHGYTTTTFTSVHGKFKTSTKATGVITWRQTIVGHGTHAGCGPLSLTFSATRK